ncbi:MAG: CheR family methyltransferase [Myxococcota bacterium]
MMAMAVDPSSFRMVAEYVRDVSGIVLEPGKEYLVENRLGPMLRDEGLSYAALIRKARLDASGGTRASIISAVTTNETSFMRDGKPFELFSRRLLPELDLHCAPSGRPLCIWSAACSTGQEPYSIAMLAKEYFGSLPPSRVHLLATDISQAALRIAKAGTYNRAEISRGISPGRLQSHFRACRDGWRITADLRSTVEFKCANLHASLDDVGVQDVIFCRNVAIYFSPEDRARLFRRLGQVLRRDGILMVGTTESLLDVREVFSREEADGVVFYRKR